MKTLIVLACVFLSEKVFARKWEDQMDRASLVLEEIGERIELPVFVRSQRCSDCAFLPLRTREFEIINSTSQIGWIDTRWPSQFQFKLKDGEIRESNFINFAENTIFSFKIGENSDFAFQESPQKSEDSSSLQQIGALAIFAGFIWKLNSFLDAENRGREPVVDTWRGINVAFMVFVNYGGGGYWWLQHSPWDGITLADLVMPSFLFLNGISIALRKKSTKRRNLKRFVKTFFLGLIVSNKGKLLSLNFDFANWRIPGVLQRIAICELIVSVLSFSNFALLTGVLLFYFLWLSIYFLATPFDLPSCPASYNGPGGISSNSQFFHCIGGSSGAIDRFFLGNSHLYQWSTAKGVFYPEEHFKNQPIVFDPEGITGTFSSILTVFFGFVAVKILRKMESFQRRTFLLGIGSILILIGVNRASTVPFNKNLWSDSFVFFTAGFNFLALLFLLDFSFPLFARLGRRSMFVYVGHTFLRGYFPFSWNSSLPPTHASIFSENLFATCLWLVLGNIFESFSS